MRKCPTSLLYVKHETNWKRSKLTQNYLFKFSDNRKNLKRQGVTFGMWRPVVWKKVTEIMVEFAASTSPDFGQTLQHIPHYSAVYNYRHKNLKSLFKKLSEVFVQKPRSTFSYITTNLSVINSVPFPISLSLICTVVQGCSCRIPLVGGGKLLNTTISP